VERKLKIALMGTRGIPARYGGFETFAEELSTRLAKKGHFLTVYARRRFFQVLPDQIYQGVTVRATPTIMHKYLETPLHALFSFLDLFFRRFDLVLLCNAANSPFAWLVRLRGLALVINVDGIERERSKWNRLGKLWYRLGELCSYLFASRIVADAKVIGEYYKQKFKITPAVIAYGASCVERSAGRILQQFGLRERSYLLYVSRLEPENNALGVIEAYKQVQTEMPLVIVGDAPYADQYKAQLKAAATEKVIFTGFQFGEAYQELQSNCYLYIQATEVGGTHPALVEAMAYGNAVIANGTPENMEVLERAGVFYQKNDFSELANQIRELIFHPHKATDLGEAARLRAQQIYSWDKIVDQYEELLLGVMAGSKG